MQHSSQGGVESSAVSTASNAIWSTLQHIIRDNGSGGDDEQGAQQPTRNKGQLTLAQQLEARLQAGGSNFQAAANVQDEDWKSFVSNYVADSPGAGRDSPKHATSRASSAYTTSSRGYVAELETQSMQEQGLLPRFEQKPGQLKSALKATGSKPGYEEPQTLKSNGGVSPMPGDSGEPTKPSPQEMFKIVMPNLDTSMWDPIVHHVVWKLGRHFGFQAFNVDPKTKGLAAQELTPATIILAGDHLSTLLCKQAYIRRDKQPGESDQDRFAKALTELHATIFSSYEHYWCKQVSLPWRTSTAQQVLLQHSFSHPRVMHGLLCELALWFLIYTESSSLRHTPEIMWFIYWCMTTSFVMAEFWHLELPDVEPNARDRRIELRNVHQKLIAEIQQQLQIFPRRVRPEDCGRMSTIITRLQDTDVPDEDFQLLGDLIAFGDGGFYCDRIVTPLFDVYAYEIDHLSNLGVDVAHRLGYDDFNESMCVKAIIHDTLRELRVKPEQLQQATVNDAYLSLTNLGFGVKGSAMSKFETTVASEFWHTKVFVKTYRERRTWAAVYRAYFRVYCFHIVAYQFLQVLAFTGWDWRMLSSCIVTHSIMKAFERLCNWFMTNDPPEPLNTTLSKVFTNNGRYRMSQAGQRAVLKMNKVAASDETGARNAAELHHQGGFQKVRRRYHILEGRPIYGVIGFIEWVVLAIIVLVWYVAQFFGSSPLRQHARIWWVVFSGSYIALHLIHFVLTLRDGYIVSLTHMLSMPQVLKASSPRPDASCWLSAPMHMKWKLLFTNALFWFMVFAMKFPFDYFVICKPVVVPLQVITYRHWLQCKGKWYVYPFPCIGGDWLLLAGRVCPFIVIIFMDTSLFYQITITIFGIVRGLFKLDLGVLTSWDEVVKEFYRAPARWWHKCMSEMGNDNQLAQLKQSMYIEDGSTGQVTQVSDGMMFKKTVLTPEEIHGRKVHFNGRGKPAAAGVGASEDGAQRGGRRADSAVSDTPKTGLLGKMSNMVRGEKESKGGALLPSSTNRTKMKVSDKEVADKRKKEEERRAQAEAKASAKKAAIAAGIDKPMADSSLHGGSGHLPKLMQRAMSTRVPAGSEPGHASTPAEEDASRPGVKGMFNKLMGGSSVDKHEELDPIAKMTADTQRNARMRKAAQSVLKAQSVMKAMKGASDKVSSLQVEQVGPSMTKEKASFTHPSAGDSSALAGLGDRLAASERNSEPVGEEASLAVIANSGSVTEAGERSDSVMGKLTRIFNMTSHGQEGDDVERMALAARAAAQARKQDRTRQEGIAKAKRELSHTGPKLRPSSAVTSRMASKVRIAEQPEEDNAAAKASHDEHDPDARPNTAPLDAAEASSNDRPAATLGQAWQEADESYGSDAVGASRPVAEGFEGHDFSIRAVPEINPAGSDCSDNDEVVAEHSDDAATRAHAAVSKPQAGDYGGPWTSNSSFISRATAEYRRPMQAHRRINPTKAQVADMLMGDRGPTACWWHLQQLSAQADMESDEDSPEDFELHDGQTNRNHATDDVRISIPFFASNRIAPGPVAEGAHDDLARWLNSSNNETSDAGAARGSTVARLPPISGAASTVGSPTSRGAQSSVATPAALSPLGRNPARPMEAELDEVFGRPIDESRPASMTQMDDDGNVAQSFLPPLPNAVPTPLTSEAGVAPVKIRPRGVSFSNDDDVEAQTPTAGDGSARSGARKKKSVKILSDGDESDARFDAASQLIAAVGGVRGAGVASDVDDEPLIGRFLSNFNLWKKKDQQAEGKAAKGSSAANKGKSDSNGPNSKANANGSGGGDDPHKPASGWTAQDLEIDDVHYQMMMWNAFASAWDEVVDDIRMSDLVSDKEVGMLKFVRLDLGSRHYGLRSILLPTFFYAGQIRKVVDTGSVSTAQIMVLNELRVLCVWLGCQVGLLSGKHAHVITSAPFYSSNINVKHALHRKKFYSSGVKMIEILEDMCSRQEVPFDMRDFAEHLFTLLTSMEAECFAINKAHQMKRCTDDELELSGIMLEVVQEMKREISKDADQLKVIFKNAVSTSATANYKELLRVVRVIKRMLTATVAEATPTGEEAQRALGFFINSLSHPSLDRPTSLDKMWSWTIMTPLYEEDVLYPLEASSLAKELGLKKKKLTDLLTEGDDSISLMSYLKSTFPDEWNNFKERMKTQVPEVDVKELSEMDFAPGNWLYDYRMELQLWASCRGQLLGRTVSGMLRNEKALRVLAKLEHPLPPDMSDLEYHRWIDQLVTSKFEMVITPQTYGKNRDSKDVRLRWLARSIQLLLQRYPKCLKAAYLEKAEVEGSGITEFSVCMKGRDPEDLNQLPHLDETPVYELYRIRLPMNRYSGRGVIIGEGKPENQNHAVIFAHGEGVQAIDMNQDGYLCEWLKFRNLLSELQPSSRGDFYLYCNDDEEFTISPTFTAAELMSVVRYRLTGTVQTALVGFREYIFSEAAGALGRFAAATEYAFGTISQRTMTHPARVRLHYGHPDLFNKLFVMTRGGMSKATRLLHLTEDVFCGCNHTLRGARIRYKEYISCGKGRDMGFDSINGFNFKIAGGGGEWAISRESHRMGTRLDFFRLMAFYHAAVGFYINSWFTYLAVYLNVYALLLYAWAQATEIQANGVQRVYNVQQVLQLGTLALIPYAGQLMLENGVIKTCLTLFQQIATGSLLFYTFQQQTVAASFSTDMTYGSGKYVGTGRGFNIVSLEFVKIFTLYARSHLYMGFELLFALATLYIVRDCQDCQYGALTWSSWLLAVTLLFAPLWFNPFSFDIQKVSNNYLAWRRWMDGDVDHTTGSNWYTWNTVQLEKIRNDGGNNTDNWLNIVGVLISCAPYMLMALGSASRLDICLDVPYTNTHPVLCNGYLIFLMATAALWLLAHVTIVLRHHWLDLANHKPWRIYTWLVSFMLVIFMLGFLVGVQRVLAGRAVSVLFLVLYANFNLLIAFHKVITPLMSQNNTLRAFSDWFYYTVDTWIGYLMFILMALLSFIGIVGVLQMKLLFNDTFSEQVKHAKIGRAMKEQKVGFDASKGGQAGSMQQGPPGSARPGTAASAASGATAFTMRSLVQSEHRYM